MKKMIRIDGGAPRIRTDTGIKLGDKVFVFVGCEYYTGVVTRVLPGVFKIHCPSLRNIKIGGRDFTDMDWFNCDSVCDTDVSAVANYAVMFDERPFGLFIMNFKKGCWVRI